MLLELVKDEAAAVATALDILFVAALVLESSKEGPRLLMPPCWCGVDGVECEIRDPCGCWRAAPPCPPPPPPLSDGDVGRDDDRRGFGVFVVVVESILLLVDPPGVTDSFGGVFAEVAVLGVSEATAVVTPSIIGDSRLW